MNWFIPKLLCLLLIVLATPVCGQTSEAAGMLSLLDDETVMVVRIEKSQLSPEAKTLLSEAAGLLPRESRVPTARALAAKHVDKFYIVVNAADIADNSACVLFARPGNWSEADAAQLSIDSDLVCRTLGDHVALGHPKTIARIEPNLSRHSSQAIAAALAESADAPIQIVLALSLNQRRVINELGVPEALHALKLDAGLVSQIHRVAISVSFAEQGSFEITVDNEDAETAQRVWQILPEIMPSALAEQTLERIESPPEQVRGRLRITNDTLVRIVRAMVQLHAIDQSIDHLRQVALQIHNHQSAYGEIPHTITDDAGKPLLSWRVKVLPFLGVKERELWHRFRTNEPWDSPHNRKLINEMPDVFRVGSSPDMDGKSNVMASSGKGRLFHGRPSTLMDVPDGLENTIMLVEGADSVAETWTKPSEFEIDPSQIAEQLGGHFPGKILITMGDGGARAVTDEAFSKQISDWLATGSP